MAKKSKTIGCDICFQEKPSKGSVQYDCFTVCKECDEKKPVNPGEPEDHDPLGSKDRVCFDCQKPFPVEKMVKYAEGMYVCRKCLEIRSGNSPFYQAVMDAERRAERRAKKGTTSVYPLIRYDKDGRFLEVILEQKEYFGDEIHPGIVLYRSEEKNAVVGFGIHGLKRPKWMKKHA